MARLNYSHASFRGVPAANLTGLFGDATTPNLIFVKSDASGNLIAGAQGDALGVIDCTEGKKDPSLANYNVAQAGMSYTVFTSAEFTEADDLSAGDEIWTQTAGDVAVAAPATAQKVGAVLVKENGVEALVIHF